MRKLQIAYLRALHCWLHACSCGRLKIRAPLQSKPSISLLWHDGVLYCPPYYTDGTITAGPIAAASWDGTGPICGMKHQSQLHLCVSLIHPSHHPSSPTPSFRSLPPPQSATRQIKSLSFVTQSREAHLWRLFICNNSHHLLGYFIHSQKKRRRREKHLNHIEHFLLVTNSAHDEFDD